MELEYLLISSDEDEKEANQEHLNLNNATEVETETVTKQGLVMGIMTPLDTISIAL